MYLDEARVFATLAVVLLHVSAGYWGSEPVRTNVWQVSNFYDGLVRWAVPVFVMISGALLLDPHKKSRVGARIFRVLVPLLVWSMIYAIIDRLHGSGWVETAEHFLLGHYHLWYLYMLIGLYLVLPIQKTVVQRAELVRYFLLLAFLFSFLLPQAAGVLSLFGMGLGDTLQTLLDKMNVQMVLGYSGYFVLGYFLHHQVLSTKIRRILYALGIAGAAVTVFATGWASIKSGVPERLFFGYFSCNVLVMSAAVFLLFQHGKGWKRIFRWAGSCAPYCLGVFLIHPLVLETIAPVVPHCPFLIGIPALSAVVFLISLGAAVAIRALPVAGSRVL